MVCRLDPSLDTVLELTHPHPFRDRRKRLSHCFAGPFQELADWKVVESQTQTHQRKRLAGLWSGECAQLHLHFGKHPLGQGISFDSEHWHPLIQKNHLAIPVDFPL